MKKNRQFKVFAIMFVIMFLAVAHIQSHYTRKDCEVISIDRDCITVEDNCGYCWQYVDTTTEYSIGDKVDIKMFDNATDSIYDDEIVKVKPAK